MKLFPKFLAALAALTMTASLAQAGSTNVGVGVNAGAFANTEINNQGSIGLAGLPGGDCSEGFTFGAMGLGLGDSKLNKYCQLAKQVYPAVQMGLISQAEGRAFILASFKGLGFSLKPTAADSAGGNISSGGTNVTSTKSPREEVRTYKVKVCELQSDGRVKIVHLWGGSAAYQAKAQSVCLTSLGFKG